jgi:hypothetical protein
MTKSPSALKSRRVTIRMTGAMYANIQRLAGPGGHIGEEIRSAIRQYLDNQGEIAGSRRYFTGRFREEVRALNRLLSWHLTLITILLAEMFSLLVTHLLDLDEETARAFTASSILKIAEERLVESGWRVRLRVEAAVDEAELEAQRRQDREN